MGLGGSKKVPLYRIGNPERFRGRAYLLKIEDRLVTDVICGQPYFRRNGTISMVNNDVRVHVSSGDYEWYADSPTYKGQLATYEFEYINTKVVDLIENDIVYLPDSWGPLNEPYSFCFAKVRGECVRMRGLAGCGFTNSIMQDGRPLRQLEAIILEPDRMVQSVSIYLLE